MKVKYSSYIRSIFLVTAITFNLILDPRQVEAESRAASDIESRIYGLLRQKAYGEATELLDHALSIKPSEPVLYRLKWSIAQDWQDYENARSYITRAIKLDPKNPELLWLLGLTAFHQQQFDEAIATWKSALNNPNLEGGIRESIPERIAWAYYLKGDFNEAVEWAERVLNNHPEWPNPNFILGTVLVARSKTSSAKKYFEKIIAHCKTKRKMTEEWYLLNSISRCVLRNHIEKGAQRFGQN